MSTVYSVGTGVHSGSDPDLCEFCHIPRNWDDGRKERPIWTLVYVATQLTYAQIHQGLMRWRHNVYERTLQCPKTAVAGWGLYSTAHMEPAKLTEYFQQKHGITIAIRYWQIQLNRSTTIPYKDWPKALHFEVDAAKLDVVDNLLHRVYASKMTDSSDFPEPFLVPSCEGKTVTHPPCAWTLHVPSLCSYIFVSYLSEIVKTSSLLGMSQAMLLSGKST